MDYDPERAGARPRRAVRPPGWMAEYDGYTLPSNTMSEQRQTREGYAETTPFTQTSGFAGAVRQTPVLPNIPHEFMTIVQQLQEDNNRLQLMVKDMRRQMDRNVATVRSTSLQFAQQPDGYISTDDTWLSTRQTTQPSSLQQEQLNVSSTQNAAEEWPVPPPPISFLGDYPDIQEVQWAPLPPPPPAIVQELSQRLQELHVQQQTAAAVSRDPDFQPRVPQSTPLSQPRAGLSLDTNMPSPAQTLDPTMAIATREKIYRGPLPSIPEFTKDDPRQFARLRLALDNILPADATERFKYQVLCDHLKFEEALLIADSYSNSLCPYSDTMASLTKHYGQPHQLSLQRIAELMDEPNIIQVTQQDSGDLH
ncbi:uncharacterized protein LOC122838916 [Gambusia affinis]|uniref:uncharacterized protein LOC122838916 n=1 Tax=Gambusia affinis TaxID=33528 RepID=UPI001CDB4AC4|nr:uncharacterized protein LOC122838916 [Gambusia affinis]